MIGKGFKWIVPVLVGFLLTACASMDQDARINFLEGQMKDVLSKSAEWGVASRDLRTRLADHAARMDKINSQIQILSGRLDDLQTGIVPKENPIFNQEGVYEEIRSLKERLQSLEGKVRELETQFSSPAESVPEAAMPGGTSPAPSLKEKVVAPATAPSSGAGKGAVQALPQVTPERKAYNDAMDLLKADKYDPAIRRFRKFIKAYPGHDLSDNAQYWIGECYYGLKKYDEAIIEFEEVVRQYPKGDKVPAALLKEGLAFHELKDNDTARQILKKIVDKYPKSEEAKIALEKMAVLK
ncbi:MAG: tol-pal system protein YbgF [Deltaproteobacteria bacterium]|nr:tol-pal system protein YbgF [Deltaproteobacteria bacterium]